MPVYTRTQGLCPTLRVKPKRQSVIFLGWIEICILSVALEIYSYGARVRLCEKKNPYRLEFRYLTPTKNPRQVLLPVIPVLGRQIQGNPRTSWLAKVARIGEFQVQ